MAGDISPGTDSTRSWGVSVLPPRGPLLIRIALPADVVAAAR
jgi:hypothetical protein